MATTLKQHCHLSVWCDMGDICLAAAGAQRAKIGQLIWTLTADGGWRLHTECRRENPDLTVPFVFKMTSEMPAGN